MTWINHQDITFDIAIQKLRNGDLISAVEQDMETLINVF
jgi:hypothetical protein